MNHHYPKHLQALPFRKDGRKAWGPDMGSRTTLDAPAPAVPPAHPGRHHGTSRGGFCGDLWRFYEDVVGIVTRSSYIYEYCYGNFNEFHVY